MSEHHLPGIWNDVVIFCRSLRTLLDPIEYVETNDGYSGEALAKVIYPKCVTCLQERKRMMLIVRRMQEMIKERPNHWSNLVPFH